MPRESWPMSRGLRAVTAVYGLIYLGLVYVVMRRLLLPRGPPTRTGRPPRTPPPGAPRPGGQLRVWRGYGLAGRGGRGATAS
jgi:hypothetical protein